MEATSHRLDFKNGGLGQVGCGIGRGVLSPDDLAKSEAELSRMVKSVYVDPSGRAEPIFDGVVSIDRWCAAPLRIMWILKEPWDEENSSGGGWSLTGDVLNAQPVSALGHATFHPIIYIAYGLFNDLNYADMPWVRDMKDPESFVRSLAFINVKKLPGVSRGASGPLILEWYSRGRQIVLRQIEAYCPHIVFACAPHFSAILDDLDRAWRNRVRSVGSADHVWVGETIFVRVWHPGQTQVSREKYVDDALGAVRQAVLSRRCSSAGIEHDQPLKPV